MASKRPGGYRQKTDSLIRRFSFYHSKPPAAIRSWTAKWRLQNCKFRAIVRRATGNLLLATSAALRPCRSQWEFAWVLGVKRNSESSSGSWCLHIRMSTGKSFSMSSSIMLYVKVQILDACESYSTVTDYLSLSCTANVHCASRLSSREGIELWPEKLWNCHCVWTRKSGFCLVSLAQKAVARCLFHFPYFSIPFFHSSVDASVALLGEYEYGYELWSSEFEVQGMKFINIPLSTFHLHHTTLCDPSGECACGASTRSTPVERTLKRPLSPAQFSQNSPAEPISVGAIHARFTPSLIQRRLDLSVLSGH